MSEFEEAKAVADPEVEVSGFRRFPAPQTRMPRKDALITIDCLCSYVLYHTYQCARRWLDPAGAVAR